MVTLMARASRDAGGCTDVDGRVQKFDREQHEQAAHQRSRPNRGDQEPHRKGDQSDRPSCLMAASELRPSQSRQACSGTPAQYAKPRPAGQRRLFPQMLVFGVLGLRRRLHWGPGSRGGQFLQNVVGHVEIGEGLLHVVGLSGASTSVAASRSSKATTRSSGSPICSSP